MKDSRLCPPTFWNCLKTTVVNCLLLFFLFFLLGFQKVAPDFSLTWRKQGRWAFTLPSTPFCSYPYSFSVIDAFLGISTALFVCFCVQADPLLGLLGFGGGMDFDSDKAYRWYRDAATSYPQLFKYITSGYLNHWNIEYWNVNSIKLAYQQLNRCLRSQK